MEKARIVNTNEFGGIYSEDWINNNLDIMFAGSLVSEWELSEILPNPNMIKPIFIDGEWVEGATNQEINELNRGILPKIVSQRQLRTQLLLDGFDLSSIQSAIDTLSEPNKSIAQIAWDFAVTFERESPLLICVGNQLELSQSQIDEIFLNASKL